MDDENEETRSPVIDAQIARTMEPYLGRFPPEVLEEMRALLEDALLTHPVLSRLVERLGPNPKVLRSAAVTREVPTEVDKASGIKERRGR